MAWPIWLRRHDLRKHGLSFVVAALVGGAAAAGSAVALAWAMGLPDNVWLSLVPKSITAPVAMGVAEKIGGIPALAAVFAVLTGLVGALSGRYLFDAMGLGFDRAGWMARGFALGTAAHGIGAAAGGAAAGALAGTVAGPVGTVIGAAGGAVIGNQLAKPANDCKRAYGYYDETGRWHATGVNADYAQGYYDRDGNWISD